MTISLDQTIVEIACPKCGKKLKEQIGRLKRNKRIKCATCGETPVETNELRRIEDAINKQLAKLTRTIHIKL